MKVASPANAGGDDESGLSPEAQEAQGAPNQNMGAMFLAVMQAEQQKRLQATQGPPAAMGGW